MKNIVVLGPPGSGKGTQIEELLKKHDAVKISGGEISRDLASKDPKIKEIIDSGALLSDEIILSGIDSKLEAADKDRMVIFDGFPRTLHQAEEMNELLAHHGRTLDAVIYIELEEQKIVDRLTKRKVCPLCGKNILTADSKCPDDGSEAIVRSDDTPNTIINRIQTFLEQTLPLVNYYGNKGILAEINGDQDVASVTSDIEEKLKYVEQR